MNMSSDSNCWSIMHSNIKTNNYIHFYPYSYSYGMNSENFPDVVITGLLPEKSTVIINACCKLIIQNLVDFDERHKLRFNDEIMTIRFIKVDWENILKFMSNSCTFYKNKDFNIYQILWPDEYGNYPTYANFKGSQFLMSH